MLYNERDIFVGGSLMMYGEYSEHECRLLCSLVSEGDTAVDAGANIGCFTVPLARKVGKTGVVHAFEPQRRVFQMLTGNVAMNDLANVHTHWAAVGAAKGEIGIADFDLEIANNFGGFSLREEYESPKITRPMMALDDLTFDRLRLIKIDVEGFERDVLDGMERTTRIHHPVIYMEADREERLPKLLEWLNAHGYRCWWDRPPLFSENNFSQHNRNIYLNEDEIQIVSVNWLCIHDGDVVTERPKEGCING
jgi:FkbM family methyltransferase